MQKFNYGDKINLKGANFTITCLGSYPAGQPVMMNLPGDERAFNVDINGCKAIFRESQMKMLLEAAHSFIVEDKQDKENLEPVRSK